LRDAREASSSSRRSWIAFGVIDIASSLHMNTRGVKRFGCAVRAAFARLAALAQRKRFD